MDKKLTILRGLPGSGKSTLANKMDEDAKILSTDHYWMQDGEYKFDPSKAGEAHKWNQARARKAMEEGQPHVVIDNTNVSMYEFKPYVQDAIKHGYNVDFQETQTPWRFSADELFKRNTHGVSLEDIQEMLSRYDKDVTVEKTLKSVAPWEPKKQDK